MYKIQVFYSSNRTQKGKQHIYQSERAYKKWIVEHRRFYKGLNKNWEVVGYKHNGTTWTEL